MLPVQITRRASAQIGEAASWWFENRPAARGALKEELNHACDLISHQPEVGARAANVKLAGVRRIHLSRVRYFLYYRVHATRIEILALWHSSRGQGPNL